METSPDITIPPISSICERSRFHGGNQGKGEAFSLIEVIIAMGIFTFCIVSIVYLLGTALSSSRQSQIDSALVGVLRSMDSELRALPYTNSSASALSLTSPNLAGTNSFFFDQNGNLTTNTASRSFRAVLTRVTNVASLTAVTNGANVSPGVTNSTNHYLWVMKVSYPAPNFPYTNSLVLGRTLQGSGAWTVGTTNYSFYE